MLRGPIAIALSLGVTTLAIAQEFPPPASFPQPSASPPVATAPSPAPELPPAETPPLATRQTTFTIPFSVDPRAAIREVQLYVSSDQGRNWSLYGRQRPDAGRFLFRAEHDGEYWFAPRTMDLRTPEAPPATFTPELRVRVDTTAPKVDLAARVGPAGEIIATYEASDDDLVTESVTIEYQPAGEQRWQTVVLDPAKARLEDGKYRGEAVWFAQTQHRAINLRIVARDGAGNSAIVNRGVYLPSVTQRSAAAAQSATSQASAAPPLAEDPFRRRDGHVSERAPQAWPAETVKRPDAQPPAARPENDLSTFKPVAMPLHDAVAQRAEPAPATDTGAFPATRPTSDPAIPAADDATPATPRDDLPPGERPSFTNKKRFKLDYGTDDIPPEQIRTVELWGTHDGGRTWLKWGDDPDRQSPFEVEVEEEGVFGYRVVIVHENGMASHAPRPGDTADIWVGVDTTLPEGRITTATFGKGINSGQLQIQWQASDAWLLARPITLSYASEPQGPWTTLAGGLANTGQYFWRVEPSVPRRVYLKLEVRDAAGNLTEHKLAEPIELEGLAPQGRIRGVVE